MNISDVISHARDRDYMGGVERERNRVKATGEVFTPTDLVQQVLNELSPDLFTNPHKTFLDNSCGDGQFLSEVLIHKLESGIDFAEALSTIYGVDLMPDNVKLCQDRLLCGREDLRHIVEQNIVCADGLKYHYRFDGTPEGYKDRDELLAENAELTAEIERHRAEKHQMHKKIGGYKTEIEKLRESVITLKIRQAVMEEESKADVLDEFFE